MSSNTELDQTLKPKNITCFIHYGESDDLVKIFEVLKDFRSRYGLKFSHHKGYIFFTLLSENLAELAQVRPFKISKFQTKSEYPCSKDICNKLIQQRDSFIKMSWDDNSNKLTFISRTNPRIHLQLIRRIFTDANIEFNRLEHEITVSDGSDALVNQVNQVNQVNKSSDFVLVEKKKPKDKSKYNSNKITTEYSTVKNSRPKIRSA